MILPPVNSSINFLMVSSCLTTFLFLTLTLPPPDSCSMVTWAPPFSFNELKEIGMCLPCHFLGNYASLQRDCLCVGHHSWSSYVIRHSGTNPIELHYSNSCHQFSAYSPSTNALTSNQFWVGPQASQPFIYPFVYQLTCATLGLTRACNQTNRWVAQTSEGPTLGSWVTHPLSVLPSLPMSHPWNKHQTPCKPCNK